jgi:hypothetical protein
MTESDAQPEAGQVPQGSGTEPEQSQSEREREFTRRLILQGAWSIPVIVAVPMRAFAQTGGPVPGHYDASGFLDRQHSDTSGHRDSSVFCDGGSHADGHSDKPHSDTGFWDHQGHGDSGGKGVEHSDTLHQDKPHTDSFVDNHLDGLSCDFKHFDSGPDHQDKPPHGDASYHSDKFISTV